MRFLLMSSAVLALVFAPACAESDTVDPGFTQLPGGGGGAGGAGGAGVATSSHQSSTGAVTSGSGASSVSATTGSTASSSASAAHSSSSSTGPGCPDDGPGESNDSEAIAYVLGTITDCDSSGSSVMGTIAGPSDVDWYVYHGNDTLGCVVDPTRSFVSSVPLRLCKYPACSNGNASFGCPNGTSPSTSPDGRPGCCGQDGFALPTLDCSGTDDDADIYIRIDNPNGDPCATYTLNYHY